MPALRQGLLVEAQSSASRQVRVRRTAALLVLPLPQQVYAERESAQTPVGSPQRRRERGAEGDEI